ncbi:MAG TPA: type 4a pilus biogenesis protein PilO [Candidatus Paceibacterota bacterium]
MKLLLPLISLVAAAGIFFGPTRSALNATTPLTEQRTSLEEALVSAQKIQTVRETLQERYNSFSSSDLARLSKMVPSHVDNVRLVIDINAMASAYGMNLKDIEIGQTVDAIENPAAGTIAGDGAEHLDMRFTVSGTYESLKLLLADLGKSLRIVDITDLTFNSRNLDVYDFSIALRTYWLQDK